MAIELRKSGVDVVGELPWGSHFCLFYEAKEDLLEIATSYCQAGLEGQEFCLWVVAEPLTVEDARHALKRAVPDSDRYFAEGSMEIVGARDWYLQDGTFDLNRVIRGWNEKLARASARGYAGVRVTGDTAWLEKKDWTDFCEYEESLNQAVANQRLAVLCTYPLAACGGAEILDVVRTHQFAVTNRGGNWDVIETAGHKQAKAEIKRLNQELEQRVVERTSQLTAVNSELTKEIIQRQRAEKALLRSEAYLAEAQKLSHTGSFGWNVSSGRIVWSDETFRIFECNPAIGPTVEVILQRTHPEDRAFVTATLDHIARDKKAFDVEHRLLMPNGSLKHVRVVGHPSTNDESVNFEFVGAVTDITESKRAEEALRASENNLRRIVDSVPGLLCALSPAGKIELANRPLLEYFGKTIEELDRWSTNDVVHPDDLHRVIDEFTSSMANGTPFNHELRYRRADGVYRWFQANIFPVRDVDGRITGWYGLITDITERRQAEEALLRSEAYLAEAQKLSHTGSWACKMATGEMIHSSEEHRLLFGLDPEREGIPSLDEFFQRIHPEDRARTVDDLEKAIRAGTNVVAHFRVVLPDGPTRYMYGIGHPVVGLAGSTGEFVGTVMDVTERKRGEEKLRQSEAYLAEAQKLSHTGSWAGAPRTGEIRYWSEECYRVLGFDPHEELPRFETFFQRLHPDDQAVSMQQFERASREKTAFEFDYRIVHPGGEVRDIHTVGSPVFGPSGEVVEFVGTVIDVTERKRAEEERERLRQAQAELAHMNRVTTMGELTASLAHEIKQPITAAVTDARTCLRWLGRDVPDVPEAREAASRLVTDVRRAAEIIGRISLLFKKDAQQQRELVDINELIREMIVLLRNEAARYSISIRSDLAEDLPTIMADRIQLQQVFMNLMLNGIEAMKDTGTLGELTIRSQQGEGSQVLISVGDTGVGLQPEHVEKVFNAFFTTKAQGTGMGLPISRSIIESHGGRLWAGTSSGRGAVFQFTLPREVSGHQAA